MVFDSAFQSLPTSIIRFQLMRAYILSVVMLQKSFEVPFSFIELLYSFNFFFIEVGCNVIGVVRMALVLFHTLVKLRFIRGSACHRVASWPLFFWWGDAGAFLF